MQVRILVVDDNPEIVSNIREFLELQQQWSVETAASGPAALDMIAHRPYDLMVLDLGLPGMDGLTVCRMLRSQGSPLPVLMLTARDAIDDRVEGLKSGADDYLVKPFSLRELSARIEALLRRTLGNRQILVVGDLQFDLGRMLVTRRGRPLKLNPICLKLLKELMQRSPDIVSRQRLTWVGWGADTPPSDSLRSNLYLLRRVVDKPFDSELIHTHPSFGWSLSVLPTGSEGKGKS